MKKFNLIEVLVVLAIIGILVTIILPVLAKARKEAFRVVCVNNLKQQGIATLSYTTDHNGLFPTYGNSIGVPIWRWLIAEWGGSTLQDVNPFYDPKLGSGIFMCPEFKDIDLTEDYYEGGYGWNYKMGYLEPDNVNITDVTHPSATILIGDVVKSSPQNWGFMVLPSPSDNWYSPSVGFHHKGGINTLWVDAHVEWKSQTALMSGKNGDIDYYYKKDK